MNDIGRGATVIASFGTDPTGNEEEEEEEEEGDDDDDDTEEEVEELDDSEGEGKG